MNLLTEEMISLFSPILNGRSHIDLNSGVLTLAEIKQTHFEKTADIIRISRRRQQEGRKTELTFSTATSFKQKGKYMIFPEMRLILQSLINRWNLVCPDVLLNDDHAFESLERGLTIQDYRLRSTRFPLKEVKIPGFIGSIFIASRLSAPMEELWQLLLTFAPFCGIGIKSTLGMGGVSVYPPL